MNLVTAITILSALSQETRLRVFKLLIEYGRAGAPAGALSSQIGVPHNTLSFHLSYLGDVGLVASRKQGRSIIYTAHCETIENLVGYLIENCCIREKKGKATCETGCVPATITKRRGR